jgi:hypothetical protein
MVAVGGWIREQHRAKGGFMSGKSRLGMAVGGTLATFALALPQMASGGTIGDVLGGVEDTVNETVGGVLGGAGGGGGTSGATPAPAPAPTPTPAAGGPETEPSLDGTNPHAEGAVIDTDINNPVLPDLGVTVGESRGEQDAEGNYSGVVRVISVTGLGSPIELAIESGEGETVSGPLGPLNDALDDLCTASDLCLTVLDYDSSTTDKGSENSFSAATVDLLDGTVAAEAVSSEGNISETNTCQTAESESTAADVGVLSDAVAADVLAAESSSTACNDGTPSESTNDSTVAELNGTGLLALLGCDEGTVDDEFPDPPLDALVDGVCNGDDTNGTQADAPYNVRKALGIEVLPAVLPMVGVGVDLDASKAETLARAPDDQAEPECPDPNNPDCGEDPPDPECVDADDPDCAGNLPEGPPDGPGGPNGSNGPGDGGGPSGDSPGDLPFTGADLMTLGLIGGLVMVAGLGLMGYADRRRKAVA